MNTMWVDELAIKTACEKKLVLLKRKKPGQADLKKFNKDMTVCLSFTLKKKLKITFKK